MKICCPACKSTNIQIFATEYWRQKRSFVIEKGKLIEINKKDPVRNEEDSYDSRVIRCQDGNEGFHATIVDKIDVLFEALYQNENTQNEVNK